MMEAQPTGSSEGAASGTGEEGGQIVLEVQDSISLPAGGSPPSPVSSGHPNPRSVAWDNTLHADPAGEQTAIGVVEVGCSADGQRCFIATGRRVQVFNLADGESLGGADIEEHFVLRAGLNYDGSLLAVASSSSHPRGINPIGGLGCTNNERGADRAEALQAPDEGKKADGKLGIISFPLEKGENGKTQQPKPVCSCRQTADTVTCFAFAPTRANYEAQANRREDERNDSGSSDFNLKIEKRASPMAKNTSSSWWSPKPLGEDIRLAMGSRKDVGYFSKNEGKVLHFGVGSPVVCVAWTWDGKHYAAGLADGRVVLRDPESLDPTCTLQPTVPRPQMRSTHTSAKDRMLFRLPERENFWIEDGQTRSELKPHQLTGCQDWNLEAVVGQEAKAGYYAKGDTDAKGTNQEILTGGFILSMSFCPVAAAANVDTLVVVWAPPYPYRATARELPKEGEPPSPEPKEEKPSFTLNCVEVRRYGIGAWGETSSKAWFTGGAKTVRTYSPMIQLLEARPILPLASIQGTPDVRRPGMVRPNQGCLAFAGHDRTVDVEWKVSNITWGVGGRFALSAWPIIPSIPPKPGAPIPRPLLTRTVVLGPTGKEGLLGILYANDRFRFHPQEQPMKSMHRRIQHPPTSAGLQQLFTSSRSFIGDCAPSFVPPTQIHDAREKFRIEHDPSAEAPDSPSSQNLAVVVLSAEALPNNGVRIQLAC